MVRGVPEAGGQISRFGEKVSQRVERRDINDFFGLLSRVCLNETCSIAMSTLAWIADARPRYGNVADSEVFKSAWSSLDDAREFITKIEALRKQHQGNEDELEKESRREIEAVISWCRKKFGEGEMRDASEVWVQPSKEHREMGQQMVIGGEGWRTF